MPVRCIALDLDRTLLNAGGRLSPANRAALLAAAHAGIEIVAASGRSFASLPEEIVTLPCLHWAITSNGAAVNRVPSGEVLFRSRMTESSVAAIRSVLRGTEYAPAVFIDGQAYAPEWYLNDPERYGTTGYGIFYVRQICRSVADWENFLDEHAAELDSYDVMIADPALRSEVFDLLRKLPQLYFTSSAVHMLEISHADSGKGPALLRLLEQLRISPDECAAFGDGENDADMLASVGYGIAVENAVPLCRASAKHITARHDEDGVALALRDYLKIIP